MYDSACQSTLVHVALQLARIRTQLPRLICLTTLGKTSAGRLHGPQDMQALPQTCGVGATLGGYLGGLGDRRRRPSPVVRGHGGPLGRGFNH